MIQGSKELKKGKLARKQFTVKVTRNLETQPIAWALSFLLRLCKVYNLVQSKQLLGLCQDQIIAGKTERSNRQRRMLITHQNRQVRERKHRRRQMAYSTNYQTWHPLLNREKTVAPTPSISKGEGKRLLHCFRNQEAPRSIAISDAMKVI